MPSRKGVGMRESIRTMYLEFAANTGVHGLKYITEEGRRPIERILWTVVVFLGLIGSIFMANNFWQRFKNSPTRASVETNHYPSWKLPFPAVTLCNVNNFFRARSQKLMDSLLQDGRLNREDLISGMNTLHGLVVPKPQARRSARDDEIAKTLQQMFEERNLTIEDLMTKLGQSCDEMIERCKWKGEMIDCNLLFERRKSYLGSCCSFNYLGVADYTDSSGKRVLETVTRPIEFTRYYSHRMGLTVLLNAMAEDYWLPSLHSAGVRMLVHSSHDFPEDSSLEKILPAKREILLRVSGTSSYCTDAVKAVDPEVRGCVFPNERELTHFPQYSAANCQVQCRANALNKFCRCVPFQYPITDGVSVCDLPAVPCLNNYFYALRTRRHVEDGDIQNKNESIECDCPALCNDVQYDVQFSVGDFEASQFQRSSFFDGVNVTGRTLFHFYIGNHVSIRTRRDIISSWNDLLSSLGGVFSLFLGCSFITVIEFVYYFTLRLYLHIQHNKVASKQKRFTRALNTKIGGNVNIVYTIPSLTNVETTRVGIW